MTTALAPALLSPADVDRLEAAVRGDLTSAITSLTALRAGAAHLVAGFGSWHDYVEARFGDLLADLRLPADERRELVLSMRTDPDAPSSQRAIAAKLGVGLGTVAADIAVLRDAGRLSAEPVKVVGTDGVRRPARGESRPGGATVAPSAPLPAPTGQVWRQAVEWLRRHPAGLTLVELARVAGWSEGKASGALSYLLHPARGLAVRLEDRRAGMRVHVLTEAGHELPDAAGDRMAWVPGELTLVPPLP